MNVTDVTNTTVSRSCPMAVFGISGVDTSGSVAIEGS